MDAKEITRALNDLTIDLVGSFLGLKLPAKGMARCPLPDHDDRTPSFEVRHHGRRWVCYACNQSGGAIDVVTRIGVKRFSDTESWIYFSIKSNASQIPVIEPGRRALVRVFDQRQSLAYVDEPPPSLREKVEACETLEELLLLSPFSKVRLHVFGYDSFSGVRHHFASPTYSKSDLRSGRFKGLVVVRA